VVEHPAIEPNAGESRRSRDGVLSGEAFAMTEIQKYLAEEVAEDLADGIITRREAMRRLGLLGVSGAAATGLLNAFAAAPAVAVDHDRGGSSTAWAPLDRQAITFRGPRGTLMAHWAAASRPRGGVLVIHENRGLTEHISTVAGRLAASGYSALALDLLSEEGGTGAFPGEAEVAAALAQIPPERFVADMKAGVTELGRRVRGKPLAGIGFCFGGGMVWRLLASREPRLAAAAPFYGPFPEGGASRAPARRCSASTAGSTRGSTRPGRRPRRRSRRRGSSTSSSPSRSPTTRSSTTPAPASTRTPRPRPGAGR
jgi:carboxymethylenebutenolidase